ncbi:helix-turn-helix transcriptional regulator [Mycobacteroides abscessus subsp. abscessus]|uniref:helix-turn-helix transcriptional regulator n=1 Tax=Mycobacteroides abscessus TaxID=36809 RepID=UPI000D6A7A07|nr:helix-turn-helix transcriptional regulator [Mycobacteroides abscessus]MDO3099860.1 helix-turn-helix transcriptional regulator [Mycobacteroides abscessus subsp. abscessus]MDO3187468.1 helix-turn-helix transcriptional regulator [Mycobacteroides abscessus subsp. abscessus]MDO3192488.1 helix-turn-helix transcriptional regulator [Mycobacteroides abscessus subsp. abscessus]MDO3369980.1 helix-turn-helix transcriptional regulator [Mycobacteroides abscessus subsp. abscessus]QSM70577.1 helix-turn-hel
MALPPGPAAEAAFVANLKSTRIAKSITQADIADQMVRRGFKWHAATVYKVERGERQIQLGESIELASILGLTLEEMAAPQDDLKNRVKLSVVEDEMADVARSADDSICEFLEGSRMLDLLLTDVPNTEQIMDPPVLKRMRRITDRESDLISALQQAHSLLIEYLVERR